MSRALPVLVGLAVLLAAGLVHGLWTDRWRPSPALAEAKALLDSLPADLGPWKGREVEQDPEMLELAGAAAHYSRSFIDPQTGDSVLVILLVGRASRMVVHRPEHCYSAAGFELAGKPERTTVEPPGVAPAEMFTGLFTRDEATGPTRLRIFWSFFAPSSGWSAPANPRLSFAQEKVLYKLYVLRGVTRPKEPIKNDPCVRLLGELLPVLDRALGAREG